MRIKCELAPYKKAVYADSDSGLMITVMFPLLEQYISEGSIQSFSFTDFIYKLKESLIKVQVGEHTYHAVRIHGFELNQPLRIAFPDTGPPLIVLVLQLYMPVEKKDLLFRNNLFIII